jgi:exopolysaccharide biosynthesis polyprenyl glycosylphosphotransferase
MLKEHPKVFGRINLLFDIFLITASFFIGFYLRFGVVGLNPAYFPLEYAVFFTTYLIVWPYLSNYLQLYSSKRLISFTSQGYDTIKTTVFCFVLASIPAFFLRQNPLSRLFILYFWLLQTGVLISFRFFVRTVLKYIRRRGYNYRQVLIAGRNGRSARIVKKIKETPEYGLRVLGFIDITDNKNIAEPSCDVELMGGLEDLERILREEVVDVVFVTLPIKSYYSKIEEIIRICEKVGVEVEIPVDLFSLKLARSYISNYDNLQCISFYTGPKMAWGGLAKRLVDVVIASTLLVLSIPLFVIVSVLIKASSKGPLFFTQQRVGYNGRLFKLIKFRTMVENAEALKKDIMALNEMDGPVFKIKNDPRITKIGRFLRKTTIDEFPQLINVLRGDMSLVGPRPPVPEEVNQYDLEDRRRLSVIPGITCIWQVSGRNEIPFEKWMELDRQYIDEWSLWLDIKILAKTLPAVLSRKGAQ